MKEKTARPLYEPPRAEDLSSNSVNGQSGILANCESGTIATNECHHGYTATQTCSPGGLASSCAIGSYLR
jgi:hypothetical protein